MKSMSNEAMASWLWAMEHPFLYTVIEVSTPALLLAFVAGKLIAALTEVSTSSKRKY